MRIITGSARGRKLKSPIGNDIMPTSDKVKESVFSMIHFEVEGARFLDIFAGSGQMGIEALSRGASYCAFVDNGKENHNILESNIAFAGFTKNAKIYRNDAFGYLSSTDDLFDIIFADPPYNFDRNDELIEALSHKLTENGVIIFESDLNCLAPKSAGNFNIYKQYKYGKTKVTQYRK